MPVTRGEERLAFGKKAAHDTARLRTQQWKIAFRKRRRCGDEVAGEAGASHLFDRNKVCVHHIGDVGATIQKLVCLHVRGFIFLPDRRVIKGSGKNRDVRRTATASLYLREKNSQISSAAVLVTP